MMSSTETSWTATECLGNGTHPEPAVDSAPLVSALMQNHTDTPFELNSVCSSSTDPVIRWSSPKPITPLTCPPDQFKQNIPHAPAFGSRSIRRIKHSTQRKLQQPECRLHKSILLQSLLTSLESISCSTHPISSTLSHSSQKSSSSSSSSSNSPYPSPHLVGVSTRLMDDNWPRSSTQEIDCDVRTQKKSVSDTYLSQQRKTDDHLHPSPPRRRRPSIGKHGQIAQRTLVQPKVPAQRIVEHNQQQHKEHRQQQQQQQQQRHEEQQHHQQQNQHQHFHHHIHDHDHHDEQQNSEFVQHLPNPGHSPERKRPVSPRGMCVVSSFEFGSIIGSPTKKRKTFPRQLKAEQTLNADPCITDLTLI